MNRCLIRILGANSGRLVRAGSHADEPNALLRSRQKRRRTARSFASRCQGVVSPDRGDRDRQPRQQKNQRVSEACFHGRK